jgi:hypothetical protein
MLECIDRDANELPAAQDMFDYICGVIGDRAVPLKARLLELCNMLALHPAIRTAKPRFDCRPPQ